MRRLLHLGIVMGALAGIFAFGSQGLFADGGKTKGQLRFLLLPAAANDQLRVVPAGDSIPADGTMVTCDSFQISNDGLIFEHAIIETSDHKATASQVTLFRKNASLRFSDDHNISFKTEKGKADLLHALQQ